ncbi:hypothetical protein [Bacillus infantis]|uniref:hypothetical protein n=1 Tax=Bacillus infantis TaxID=324767 RepID=UPI0013EA1F33|nr:hypothetical protein [Bacillus infantis]
MNELLIGRIISDLEVVEEKIIKCEKELELLIKYQNELKEKLNEFIKINKGSEVNDQQL